MAVVIAVCYVFTASWKYCGSEVVCVVAIAVVRYMIQAYSYMTIVTATPTRNAVT